MKIGQDTFRGEIPKLADHLLPNGYSQLASNCSTKRGGLQSFRDSEKQEALDITTCLSLFQYTENTNDHWVAEETVHHYCNSPISGDQYERVYYTGENEARFFANDNISGGGFDKDTDYYKLGIPAPTTIPTVTTTGGGATYRAYVYAFVNSYGEEGPPSDVGSASDYDTGYVTIDSVQAFPTGRAIDTLRLYRANATAFGTAEFQFVLDATLFSAAVGYAVGEYVLYDDGGGIDLYKCTSIHAIGAWNAGHFTQGENVDDDDLLSVFPKTNFYPPPDGLTNLVMLANGSMAGFKDNIVYLSEPFYPHAWPPEYQIPLDIDIVGMATEKNVLVAAGTGKPFIIYGTHPSTMARIKADEVLPLFNIRGICSGMSGIFFVSKQGIVYSNGSAFYNITGALIDADNNALGSLIDPEDWGDLNYASLAIHWYENALFAFDSVNDNGFIIDFSNNLKEFVRLSVYAHAGFVANDGHFYIVQDDIDIVDENDPPASMPLAVMQWEGSTINFLLYTYQSKLYLLPHPTNFGACYIVLDQEFYDSVDALVDLEDLNAAIFAADFTSALGIDGPLGGGHELGADEMLPLGSVTITGNVTFKLYANGVLRKTKLLSAAKNKFTLPSKYLADDCYYEISGYVPVKKIIIANEMDEL